MTEPTPVLDWIRKSEYDTLAMVNMLNLIPNKYAIQQIPGGKYLDHVYNLVDDRITPFLSVQIGSVQDSVSRGNKKVGLVFDDEVDTVFVWDGKTNTMVGYRLSSQSLINMGTFQFSIQEWDVPYQYYDRYNNKFGTKLRPMSPQDRLVAEQTYLLSLRMKAAGNRYHQDHCLVSDPNITNQPAINKIDCCSGNNFTIKFTHVDIPPTPGSPATNNSCESYDPASGNIVLYTRYNIDQNICVPIGDKNFDKNPGRFNGKMILFIKDGRHHPRKIMSCTQINRHLACAWALYCKLDTPSGFFPVTKDDYIPYTGEHDINANNWTMGDGIITLNSQLCAKEWCPFSTECVADTLTMVDYCGSITRDGAPMLNTDDNCTTWQTFYPLETGKSAEIFCNNFQNKKPCGCQKYTSSPDYKAAEKMFQAIPGCEKCKVIPYPVCWAAPCTVSDPGPDQTLLTTRQQQDLGGCKGLKITFCNQIIDIVNAHGDVHVDNNTFKMVCGEDLPDQRECKTVKDCKPNEICSNGKCITAKPCDSDKYCWDKYGSDYVCKDGFCDQVTKCQIDHDCINLGKDYVCSDGICTHSSGPEPTPKPFWKDMKFYAVVVIIILICLLLLIGIKSRKHA
jgi:hypothetical protein